MGDRADLVPGELRAAWVEAGYTPGVDLRTLFDEQVARHPDKVAVIDDDKSTTYAELGAMADRIAGLLMEWGIVPGDVVALQLPNIAEACAADLAVASVGAICLPYPVLYRHHEVRSLLARSGAVACLIARRLRDPGGSPASPVRLFDYAAMLSDLRPELPALRHVGVLGGIDGVGDVPGCDSIDERLNAPGPPPPRPAVAVGPHDPARILVTSGTESAPKMVLYSHAAVGGGIGNILGALRPDDDSRFLLLPPLSTGFGSLGTFAGLARYGVTLVVTPAFDPAGVVKLIERERITHMLAVPTMLAMLLAQGAGDADLSSLRVVGSFGAAMSEDRVRAVLALFGGARFVNGYGCSDGAVCLTGWDDPPEKIAATVGRAWPATTEIRILDDAGAEPAPGDTGEICARGPMSPLRYLHSPELDALYRFDGGWVRTGDLGFIDADGYLHIAGRKKDIIVRGGYNISPAETEAGLVKHPAIAEAACVGYPDERLGERMCAFVVLAPGADAPSLDDLRAFLEADGLARIKIPERLEVIDAMPLNPSGKILKRVLRTHFDAPEPEGAKVSSRQ